MASKDVDYQGAVVKKSLKEAIDYAYTINQKIYIIGGASVYRQSIEIATKLEITKIDKEYQGDTFFQRLI